MRLILPVIIYSWEYIWYIKSVRRSPRYNSILIIISQWEYESTQIKEGYVYIVYRWCRTLSECVA